MMQSIPIRKALWLSEAKYLAALTKETIVVKLNGIPHNVNPNGTITRTPKRKGDN